MAVHCCLLSVPLVCALTIPSCSIESRGGGLSTMQRMLPHLCRPSLVTHLPPIPSVTPPPHTHLIQDG